MQWPHKLIDYYNKIQHYYIHAWLIKHHEHNIKRDISKTRLYDIILPIVPIY